MAEKSRKQFSLYFLVGNNVAIEKLSLLRLYIYDKLIGWSEILLKILANNSAPKMLDIGVWGGMRQRVSGRI